MPNLIIRENHMYCQKGGYSQNAAVSLIKTGERFIHNDENQ